MDRQTANVIIIVIIIVIIKVIIIVFDRYDASLRRYYSSHQLRQPTY